MIASTDPNVASGASGIVATTTGAANFVLNRATILPSSAAALSCPDFSSSSSSKFDGPTKAASSMQRRTRSAGSAVPLSSSPRAIAAGLPYGAAEQLMSKRCAGAAVTMSFWRNESVLLPTNATRSDWYSGSNSRACQAALIIRLSFNASRAPSCCEARRCNSTAAPEAVSGSFPNVFNWAERRTALSLQFELSGIRQGRLATS